MRFTVFILILVSHLAQADYKEFHFRKSQDVVENFQTSQFWNWVPFGIAPQDETISEATYDQRLDHDSCCDFTTFKQRYYIDSSLAQGPESPVFLYICGEATCEPRSLNGAIREHAKKFGAHLVALEHRFYGKSQPFAALTVKNLKYLSTRYAVKDLATFLEFGREKLGLKGKWVAFGGSYPGSLSAYFRQKLPSLVVGSIASSAPVRAHARYEEYDEHVSRVAGKECGDAVRSTVKELDSYFGTEKLQEVKKLFAAEVIKDDTDFLYIVADIAAAAVQYGFHKDFCTAVQSKDPIKGYGDFAQTVYKKFGMDALHWSMFDGAIVEDPAFYLEGFGMRQWLYQSCNEYGYWQVAFHDANVSMRSQRINLEYHNTLCTRLFGIQTPVDTSNINTLFYEPLFSKETSRIYMTNGSNDPWSRLSITEESVKQQEQQQGQKTGHNLKLYTIQGAAHCDDLRLPKPTDSEALKLARTQWQELLTDWLK